MAEKKIIERNLPLNTKYQFVSLTRGSIETGQVTSCHNCGQLITNIVTIINEKGQEFMIGTDCSETLIKASAIKMLKYEDYDSAMYSLRVINRFMTQYNKLDSKITFDQHYCSVEFLDSKGKTRKLTEFILSIKRFYPNFNPNDKAS